MFLRRSRSASLSATDLASMTTEERATLLAKVREGISDLASTCRELDRQVDDLHMRLDQLDGLAQRVALSGMLQHGVEILDHQHALAEELAGVERERADLAALEEQLYVAERRLTNGSRGTSIDVAPDGDTPRPSDAEPTLATERLRSLPRLESASS